MPSRINAKKRFQTSLLGPIGLPLLLEFVGANALGGLEMYAPLRYLGSPAELVSYAGEEHNFVKPKARIAAMARKADWFNFWLLGKKDPNPSTEEQYKRWELMKAHAARRV